MTDPAADDMRRSAPSAELWISWNSCSARHPPEFASATPPLLWESTRPPLHVCMATLITRGYASRMPNRRFTLARALAACLRMDRPPAASRSRANDAHRQWLRRDCLFPATGRQRGRHAGPAASAGRRAIDRRRSRARAIRCGQLPPGARSSARLPARRAERSCRRNRFPPSHREPRRPGPRCHAAAITGRHGATAFMPKKARSTCL